MIMIELPDDVALALMTQISNQVGKVLQKSKEPVPPPNKTQAVLDFIRSQTKGTLFRNVDIQLKLGIVCGEVTTGLKAAHKLSLAKMRHRGTWERI